MSECLFSLLDRIILLILPTSEPTGGHPTEYTVFFLLLSRAYLALQSDYLCILHLGEPL